MNRENVPDEIICDDIDLNNSLDIINCLLFHTTKVFSQLKVLQASVQKGKLARTKPVDIYWQNLPDNFSRKKALEIAALLGIKVKTSGGYLDKYIQLGKLERVEHGAYKKVA